MKLSHLAETLIGSEIIKLAGEIKEKQAKGEKIYNFTIGDFDPKVFPIPVEFEQEIINAYKEHYTNYPPADGIAELRKAVGDFIAEREESEKHLAQLLKRWAGSDFWLFPDFQIMFNEVCSKVHRESNTPSSVLLVSSHHALGILQLAVVDLEELAMMTGVLLLVQKVETARRERLGCMAQSAALSHEPGKGAGKCAVQCRGPPPRRTG